VKIPSGINRRDGAVTDPGFNATKLHLGGSESSPETDPVIRVRPGIFEASENLLRRLGVGKAILEQLSILAPHVAGDVVAEDSSAPRSHVPKPSGRAEI